MPHACTVHHPPLLGRCASTFPPAVGVLFAAFGLGLALFVGISIAGKVSSGHYHPAVTVGLAAARHFAWANVPAWSARYGVAAYLFGWLAAR